MLTDAVISNLQDITAALKIPFDWREDADGTVAFVGRKGLEEKYACRSLREVVATVASQVLYKRRTTRTSAS